jgi:cobalt-precorrin 5A hydrolase
VDLGEALIAAGIGCRKAISATEVEAALQAALAAAMQSNSLVDGRLSLIAAPAVRGTEAGLIAAAAARGVPLRLIPQPMLEAANPRTLTHSARSMAAMNVNSVAEAAALAAAGPNARLLAPRIAVGPVTCALAEGENSQ